MTESKIIEIEKIFNGFIVDIEPQKKYYFKSLEEVKKHISDFLDIIEGNHEERRNDNWTHT